MNSPKILIVEDNHSLAIALSATAERCQLKADCAPSLAIAKEFLENNRYQGILLDIGLPDGHGLQLLESWSWGERPRTGIITAHGDIDTAINARQFGVGDFFDKPLDFDALTHFLKDCAAASQKNDDSRNQPANPPAFIGAAPSMRPVFRQIAQACATTLPVIIRGATGSGKSHVAQLIASRSAKSGSYQHFSASSLNQSATFPPLEPASHLVIENIHLLEKSLQSQLAEILDAAGSHAPRIIATIGEADLRQLVLDACFHSDLYYRLQVLELYLPPLSQRKDDIAALTASFLGELDHTGGKWIDEETLVRLENYDWPGNLRELRNVINYMLISSAESTILSLKHLPPQFSNSPASIPADHHPLEPSVRQWLATQCQDPTSLPTFQSLTQEVEQLMLEILLENHNGKQSHLAAAHQINRATLRKKLQC